MRTRIERELVADPFWAVSTRRTNRLQAESSLSRENSPATSLMLPWTSWASFPWPVASGPGPSDSARCPVRPTRTPVGWSRARPSTPRRHPSVTRRGTRSMPRDSAVAESDSPRRVCRQRPGQRGPFGADLASQRLLQLSAVLEQTVQSFVEATARGIDLGILDPSRAPSKHEHASHRDASQHRHGCFQMGALRLLARYRHREPIALGFPGEAGPTLVSTLPITLALGASGLRWPQLLRMCRISSSSRRSWRTI